MLLTLNQAMMFSYVERIGVDHGFGPGRANMVLIAVGFVNLFPAVLAAALQKKISPRMVGMAAPILQGVLALTITQAQSFGVYAAAASVYVFVMIFSHVFLFELIARLDPSGRAVASTAAMVTAELCHWAISRWHAGRRVRLQRHRLHHRRDWPGHAVVRVAHQAGRQSRGRPDEARRCTLTFADDIGRSCASIRRCTHGSGKAGSSRPSGSSRPRSRMAPKAMPSG